MDWLAAFGRLLRLPQRMDLIKKYRYAILVCVSIVVLLYFSSRARSVVLSAAGYVVEAQHAVFFEKLHRVAKPIFAEFIQRCKAIGYTIIITSGYRSWADQLERIAAGDTTTPPGYSFHNYGMALDINAISANDALRKATSKARWEASGIIQIADELGLRWGGRFGAYDPVHFDLGNDYDTDQLYDQALAQYGNEASVVGYNVAA